MLSSDRLDSAFIPTFRPVFCLGIFRPEMFL